MKKLLSAILLLSLLITGVTPTAFAGKAWGSDSGCNNKKLVKVHMLQKCVNADDVFEHLQAFQAIADANGGSRTTGTPGFDQSADYVAGLLEDAGFNVERQEFSLSTYTENSSSLTIAGAPVPTQSMSFSGSGTVINGNVIPVDLDPGLGNSSTSACEPADFVGSDWTGPDDIALIQRGACAFGTKAINAQAAGAEAVIIFNQGNTADPGRQNIIGGTLGAGVVGVLTIPVLDTSYSDGLLAFDAAPSTVSLSVDSTTTTRTTENVIGDLPGVNPDNVVMAGAHLDSVNGGPGINGNGSGAAALLAVALQLGNNKKYTPHNTLRFAWWGAHEFGLGGSNEYIFNPVFGLTDEEYGALALYLNFDTIGSPNFIFGVYDADQSTYPSSIPVPTGSDALEDLFEAFYSIEKIPYDDSEFSINSDNLSFNNVGIPSGGLFTGASGIKTVEQEAIWGGTAGDQFDPCYNLACDTIDNVSVEAIDVNVDAIAYAIYNLAETTEAVNGVVGVTVKGKKKKEVELDGPQGTFLP